MEADPRLAAQPSPVRLPPGPYPARIPLPATGEVRSAADPVFRIRSMDPEDLPFVVTEHRRIFPDGFFARLGPAFLTAYTRTYMTGPHARGYVAEVNRQPVGFLVGVLDPAEHRRHVLQAHGRGLLLRALGGLALRPLLALRFLRTRLGRYARKLLPGRRPAAQPSGPPGPSGVTAVLAHVAVLERARSRGIGDALIQRFVGDAAAHGCVRVSLVTVAGPGGAGPYYESRGWIPVGQSRTPDGLRLATYDFPLRDGGPGGPR
ncbi:GNAT family N-acetyltransferase [Streptomyces iakyrus]|uniref:GNAT family N-acetyltransferase n=1 Tax=Streptomyces iakyrus TaxID=68219 RepID=UPI0033BD3639